MSKRQARKMIAAGKPGCTVKEFLAICKSHTGFSDYISGTEYEYCYYALASLDMEEFNEM